MGLLGDVLGAVSPFTKSGMVAGALKMIGVPEKIAHAAGLAMELSKGMTKDGFDFDKVNKGALARHALKAFGVYSPGKALALTAAMHIIPKGFVNSIGSNLGGLLTGGAGLAVGAGLAGTVLGGLSKMQGSFLPMLAGLGLSAVGGGSLSNILSGTTLFGAATGNDSANMKQFLGINRAAGGLGSAVANLPKPAMFEDILFAFMQDVVKDEQERVMKDLRDLQQKADASGTAGGKLQGTATKAANAAGGKNATQAATDGNQESRNLKFEEIKYKIQVLTQMQQAISNVINTMHEEAQNAIRHIKA